MKIGFMRNKKEPNHKAQLTAMLCKFHGIDLIYLRPRDVDTVMGTVKGKMLVDDAWVDIETILPPFIDIAPDCFMEKNQQIMDFLRTYTFLSDDRTNRLSKRKLQDKLKQDDEYAHLVIPTNRVRSHDDVEDFLKEHIKVVLKPINGGRGRGIYILQKDEDGYTLGYEKEIQKLTYEDFLQFYEEAVKGKNYIVQKHIHSRTKQGDPFDCRIHVEKNGEGDWEAARNFIRIGIGQKVISNVNQGGGISDIEPFLEANFGEKSHEILDKIDHLAATLPYKIEEWRDTHIMSLGFDVAIDPEGQLYLFESNGSPITTPLESKAGMLRASYYKYLLENEL